MSLVLISTLLVFTNCDDSVSTPNLEYVTFGAELYSAGVDVGSSNTVNIPVFTGNKESKDRVYNVIVDGSAAAAGSYTIPTSITIPGGSNEGSLTVGLSDTDLGIGVNKLTISFEPNDGSYYGAATRIEYTQNCTEVTATLDLVFDQWGSEVSWSVKDALDGVVASGGGYPDTAAGTSTSDTKTFNLCSGRTYTLETTDAYGDGWGSVGSYTLTVGAVVKVTGDSSTMNNGGTGAMTASAAFDTN